MAKKFQVLVFGKNGCDKCKILNQRLDGLLEKDEWQDFEKVYCSLDTEEGLVAFAQTECINPQRIPALALTSRAANGTYTFIPNRKPDAPAAVFKSSKLYPILGLQTDYSAVGKGVISPAMITAALTEARQACP